MTHGNVSTPLLPEIPGGWAERLYRVGPVNLTVAQPARPDAFLDDDATLEANKRDDFMPYWAYLWPAALPMAESVARFADWPAEAEVLELGAGIGIVGLTALARGWKTTFSDYSQAAVDLALHNAALNRFEQASGRLIDWRRPSGREYSVILGCEVLYETGNHAPILDTLDALLAPRGVVWIGDPGRQNSLEFPALARRRGYRVEISDGQGNVLPEMRHGRYQLIMLRKESQASG